MPKTLRLILGDQLNQNHSWFRSSDENVVYLMMEMRQETDYVRHHIQKVVAFFSAMRHFARWLILNNHEVIYMNLSDPDNKQNLVENIRMTLGRDEFRSFEYLLPDEYRLDIQLKDFSTELNLPTRALDTEHFLSTREELADFFGQKNFLMESFYRDSRKKHGWLMDSGSPVGGKWNYDQENRKSLPKGHSIVEPLVFENDVSEILSMLEASDVQTIGTISAGKLIWPATREQSLSLFTFFLEHCLRDFGKYQDAMDTSNWSLYHARISFALNTKMLHPKEVVEQAIEHYENHHDVSLSAVEGFVRQIAGWREFIRGVYWAQMPNYEKENQLNHHAPLPEYYWTGKTKMSCMKYAIEQSLEYAYAHHIQRLMVTGNFALMANVDPKWVDEWYLGIYIDAIQWVELPNTRGMSQFADGGLVATKPYISSANYINKMGNYCHDCVYDPKLKIGEGACPFNSLYWNFLMKNKEVFSRNSRMSMVYHLLNKMTESEREALRQQAQSYLTHINEL